MKENGEGEGSRTMSENNAVKTSEETQRILDIWNKKTDEERQRVTDLLCAMLEFEDLLKEYPIAKRLQIIDLIKDNVSKDQTPEEHV